MASTVKEGDTLTDAERAAKIRAAESALYAGTNNFDASLMQQVTNIRNRGTSNIRRAFNIKRCT